MIFVAYIGESELTVTVTYSFTPEIKAKINCLPDDSRPAEAAELEIESVMVFKHDIYDILSPAIKELLNDQALSHAVNSAIDHAEIEADRAGDKQRELRHWDENQ